ncbi:allantoicase-like [Onthophagus taurus]|uniref:allantoicase-like n=1 Tax=Onthophagus taurus TaxID=166361 RepID=UPI0039BE6AA5
MSSNDFYEIENLTDLICEKNGGKIVFATDDWFAPAENLLLNEDPVFKVGVFTTYGKWMDGWETRRKRKPGHDWCVIKLGLPGVIRGVEVDTAFFTGNYAPQFSVQAANLTLEEVKKFPSRPLNSIGTECSQKHLDQINQLHTDDWTEIIPMTPLNPGYLESRHNFFKVDTKKCFTHIRLNMFPDGGIARLRVYGDVHYTIDMNKKEEIDLIALKNGGYCHSYSNAHYGHPKNLIRPGRGKDMGDGWETARRADRPPILKIDENNILKVPGNEWAILGLGCVGKIERIEIDTAHFKGNYPDCVKIEGGILNSDEFEWKTILPSSKLSAHKIHQFGNIDILNNESPFTHVKIIISPDGGLSRVRIFGKPISNLLGVY